MTKKNLYFVITKGDVRILTHFDYRQITDDTLFDI